MRYRSIFSILFYLFVIQVFLIQFAIASGHPSQVFQDGRVAAKQILSLLQHKHQVQIFYLDEWFGAERYSLALAEHDLEEAVGVLSRGHNLDVLFLEGVIVFIPSEGASSHRLSDSDGELIIGNINNFGRFSRATILGSVYDGGSGEPLMGAVVFETNSERGASANQEGKFMLELPVGTHRIRVSYIGYEESIYDIRLISDGEVSFELFSSTEHLEAFTVMARRAREHILRTQMSRIELDAVMIKELPQVFGERDVVRSITMLPGIQTIGELGTGFNVRGGSADQNLILVEHVPLFNSSHLFGLISVVNPDLVSEVVLMKAGIPARYGERASSVLDIRMGNGLGSERTSLTGGLGIVNSRLLLQTPVLKDKASFSMAARSSYSDWLLRRIPAEDLMNSHAGFYDLTAHSQIAVNPNNMLTMFGYYSHDRFGFSGSNQYSYANTLFSARWNSFINSRLSSTAVIGWSRYDHTIDEQPAYDTMGHFSIQSDIDYKTAKWHLSWLPDNNHVLEAGLGMNLYNISPGNKNPLGESSLVPSASIDNERALEMAFFVSDDYQLNDRMSLDVGLRFVQYLQLGPASQYVYLADHPRNRATIIDSLSFGKGKVVSRYNGLEPRLGIRYQIGENSSLKGSYGRIKQYINLVSNTAVMSPSDLWKLSDIYLKPLNSQQFALGYFRNFSDNTIETSVEAYYKLIHNALEYKSGAEIAMNSTIETDLVNARGYNLGLELYAKKNSGRLTGWASYTWSTSRRRTNSPYQEHQINKNEWFPSNHDRPHNLVVNTNYHISRRWRFGATFTYNTGRPVTLPESAYLFGNNLLVYYSDRNKYRLPDYHRLDVSISLGENHRLNQRGKGHWTFTIMNLYGRKNPYSVYYKREEHTLGSGRSFNLYQMYIIGVPFPTLTYNFSI